MVTGSMGWSRRAPCGAGRGRGKGRGEEAGGVAREQRTMPDGRVDDLRVRDGNSARIAEC